MGNSITTRLTIGMAVSLLLSTVTPVSTYAGESARIFDRAPAPEELANILFPPRYRSAEPPRAQAFGMMIHFEFDSSAISAESELLLDTVGEMMHLEKMTNRAIVIEGHTDAIGTKNYNAGLSERRARAIKNYLVGNFAIESKRLVTLGKGELDLHDQHNPAAPINRRALFRPLKKLILK